MNNMTIEYFVEDGLENLVMAIEQNCRSTEPGLYDDGALSTNKSLLDSAYLLGLFERVGEYQYSYVKDSLAEVTAQMLQEVADLRAAAARADADAPYAALGRKMAIFDPQDQLTIMRSGDVYLHGKYHANIWAAFGLPEPLKEGEK